MLLCWPRPRLSALGIANMWIFQHPGRLPVSHTTSNTNDDQHMELRANAHHDRLQGTMNSALFTRTIASYHFEMHRAEHKKHISNDIGEHMGQLMGSFGE